MNFSLFPRMPHVLCVFLNVITVRTLETSSYRRLQLAVSVTSVYVVSSSHTHKPLETPLVFSKYNFVYIFHPNIEANIYIPFRATSARKLWLPLQVVIQYICSDHCVFEFKNVWPVFYSTTVGGELLDLAEAKYTQATAVDRVDHCFRQRGHITS